MERSYCKEKSRERTFREKSCLCSVDENVGDVDRVDLFFGASLSVSAETQGGRNPNRHRPYPPNRLTDHPPLRGRLPTRTFLDL